MRPQPRKLALFFDLLSRINLGRRAFRMPQLALDVIAGRAGQLRLSCRPVLAITVLDAVAREGARVVILYFAVQGG